jgi:hypothetical protein
MTEEKKRVHGTNATRLKVMIRMSLTGIRIRFRPSIDQVSTMCRPATRRGYGLIGALKMGRQDGHGVTLLPHLVPTQP